MNQGATKYCSACAEMIDARAEICPKCGVRQQGVPSYGSSTDPVLQDAASKKLAAGLCGILLGSLGVHKFILGMTTPAVTMLLVTLLTCGFGAFVTHIIGLVEGIIYLTKSDEEFYQTYIVGKKEWF